MTYALLTGLFLVLLGAGASAFARGLHHEPAPWFEPLPPDTSRTLSIGITQTERDTLQATLFPITLSTLRRGPLEFAVRWSYVVVRTADEHVFGFGDPKVYARLRFPSLPDTLALGSALAWRRGALIYHDELLGVVLEDLERRFDIELILQAPALQRKRVNFSKHNPPDAEAVIHDLCAGYGLKYRATTTGYELYDPGMN